MKSMDEGNLKALVSLLDDDDREVLVHVENQIISLGDTVIPYLEMEWEKNFNPLVQKRIEDLIHTVQFDALKKKLTAWKEDGGKDLLEGLWLVSTFQYPDLEFDKLRATIEQIYYETWLELKNNLHPFDQIKIINDVLFGKLKFGANTKNFHSPSNS
ncbi:MAG: transglutaminase-like domain-containing protein, partial [Cytophagales bacterium]|nr:transglutaminase-like domain-containing protein [Cytophagales bacterium]